MRKTLEGDSFIGLSDDQAQNLLIEEGYNDLSSSKPRNVFAIDREQAGAAVITYVQTYVPISGKMQSYIFDTTAGVINARGQAGVLALLTLIWTTMKIFSTLTSAMNKAWGASQVQ